MGESPLPTSLQVCSASGGAACLQRAPSRTRACPLLGSAQPAEEQVVCPSAQAPGLSIPHQLESAGNSSLINKTGEQPPRSELTGSQ